MKKKQRRVAILASCLFLSLTAPAFAGAGLWDKIKALFGDDSTPCWNQKREDLGCSHCFIWCIDCSCTIGLPEGPQGTC